MDLSLREAEQFYKNGGRYWYLSIINSVFPENLISRFSAKRFSLSQLHLYVINFGTMILFLNLLCLKTTRNSLMMTWA